MLCREATCAAAQLTSIATASSAVLATTATPRPSHAGLRRRAAHGLHAMYYCTVPRTTWPGQIPGTHSPKCWALMPWLWLHSRLSSSSLLIIIVSSHRPPVRMFASALGKTANGRSLSCSLSSKLSAHSGSLLQRPNKPWEHPDPTRLHACMHTAFSSTSMQVMELHHTSTGIENKTNAPTEQRCQDTPTRLKH